MFENPAHDFPQRVIYRRLGADAVTGRIEGQIGGQARSVDFPYKRGAHRAIDFAPPVSMFRASYFDRVGTCATIAGISTMAKPASIKIRLNSTADTGFFYVTKKNARTKTEKMVLKKYDPVVRKHVEFHEGKIK